MSSEIFSRSWILSKTAKTRQASSKHYNTRCEGISAPDSILRSVFSAKHQLEEIQPQTFSASKIDSKSNFSLAIANMFL